MKNKALRSALTQCAVCNELSMYDISMPSNPTQIRRQLAINYLQKTGTHIYLDL